MLSQRGRVSNSFLVAVVAVLAVVVGYAAYSFLRPDPYQLSERVVRDSRRLMATVVREFQREADTMLREAKRSGKDPAGQLEKLVNDAKRGIDAVVNDAHNQLSEHDIELRTQRNRMERISGRAQEARQMIEEYAQEAKGRAQGGT